MAYFWDFEDGEDTGVYMYCVVHKKDGKASFIVEPTYICGPDKKALEREIARKIPKKYKMKEIEILLRPF